VAMSHGIRQRPAGLMMVLGPATARGSGARARVVAADFYQGAYFTALESSEILTRSRSPFRRPAMATL